MVHQGLRYPFSVFAILSLGRPFSLRLTLSKILPLFFLLPFLSFSLILSRALCFHLVPLTDPNLSFRFILSPTAKLLASFVPCRRSSWSSVFVAPCPKWQCVNFVLKTPWLTSLSFSLPVVSSLWPSSFGSPRSSSGQILRVMPRMSLRVRGVGERAERDREREREAKFGPRARYSLLPRGCIIRDKYLRGRGGAWVTFVHWKAQRCSPVARIEPLVPPIRYLICVRAIVSSAASTWNCKADRRYNAKIIDSFWILCVVRLWR